MSERLDVRAVLREHLPKDDRYDQDGQAHGTCCTCGEWRGDYFTDGEAGPFDDHLAAAITAHIGEVLGQVREDVADSECGGGLTADEAADFGLEHVGHYPNGYAAGCDGCSAAESANNASRAVLAVVAEALLGSGRPLPADLSHDETTEAEL